MNPVKEERKTERITARVSASVHETLEYAASLQGATINQFLLNCAIKGAKEVIETELSLKLSIAESRTYLDLLASPPKPNARAKAAFDRYQQGTFSV
ncbi:MAG: hypothetical protein ACJAWL_001068 [Motiliproteus sp.]|jgi:uncharacterized protein (DUF1778 family)